MKRPLSFFLLIIICLLIGGGAYFSAQVPKWKITVNDLIEKTQGARLDSAKWQEIRKEAETLPSIYPISCAKNVFIKADEIVKESQNMRAKLKNFFSGTLKTQNMLEAMDTIKTMREHTDSIASNLKSMPDFLLTSEQRVKKQNILKKVAVAKQIFDDTDRISEILKKFIDREDRVLFLFQNQNEPRSTGGFVGSMVIVDFGEENIKWDFSDVYALDRLVKEKDQLTAPEFFYPLSKTISLRDANFFPDFPTTADTYRTFFKKIEEKSPSTVVAINFEFIGELLKITGPIKLTKWDMQVNQYNFDVVLQFLIGSKIEGRFGVKKPLLYFAEELFKPENFSRVTEEQFSNFNFSDFFAAKNVLANSENSSLQKFFDQWKISGRLERNPDSDNFLYFDFVSVGANKSEKFIWTKLSHNSKIARNGKVKNLLEITRNNAITKNEIMNLLGTNSWSPNIRDLLTNDLLWVLGEGQNRTVLRVWVPAEAKLLSQINPSGKITESLSSDKKFKIFDVPLFVSPGEKIKVTVEYETNDQRGNFQSRPYFLHVIGTPGRQKTTFLSTISTEDKGRFRVETMNIGEPVPLVDQYFRTVIDFPE